MHTLQWNAASNRWRVMFVGDGLSNKIGEFERGQDAVDLVNALNGGSSAVVTEEEHGLLGVAPQPSDAELMEQLKAQEELVAKVATVAEGAKS